MADLFDKKFKPMLLEEVHDPFNSKDYYFEAKLDGIRALVFVTPNTITIRSRNFIDITYKFPELEKIKKIVNTKTIFDGEIVFFYEGRPSFSKLEERFHLKDLNKIKYQSEINPITFIAFDIIYQGKDLTNLPLVKRKEILEKYSDEDVFLKNKFIEEKGKEFFQIIKKLQLEGMVAKKKNSSYLINKRSFNWVKVKNLKIKRFIIGGFVQKSNGLSIYLGEYVNNKLYFVGKAILTSKHPLYKKVLMMEKISNNPFLGVSDNFIYLKPTLKCLVSYLERSKNNHLREATIK